MPAPSDVFKIRRQVMRDYRDFVTSFVRVRDDRIRGTVEHEIEGGRLWPEPLIQFNPSYLSAVTGRDLHEQGVLHRELLPIFGSYRLYRHQEEAIRLASKGKDFVVTSGTGSGKSLAYVIPILDRLFREGHEGRGGFAVIVYPMNALINSQLAALREAAKTYEVSEGKPFPIDIQRYTGQERQDVRDRLKEKVPQVLLTNYMMLELILTRSGDSPVREVIRKNLRFLVFDELHTYRGRQGADVGLLVRRVKALAENPVVCIGTSATMASGTSIEEEKNRVASFAGQIFGITLPPEQVIRETLIRSFSLPETEVTRDSVASAVEEEISREGGDSPEGLAANPLANFIETSFALRRRDGILSRGVPVSLDRMADTLSGFCGLAPEKCRQGIERFLLRISRINMKEGGKDTSYLPFKLHQFISQTGTVYLSLGASEKRIISLDPLDHVMDEKQRKIPLFPLAFSRHSGCEYLCVRLDPEKNRIVPREFDEYDPPDEDAEEKRNPHVGYLIPDITVWDPQKDLFELPETWFKRGKTGEPVEKDGFPVPAKDWAERLPKRISYDERGFYSKEDDLPLSGWYMPVPLPFDPASGVIYPPNTKESTKLSRLGSEGRSTSTTILSLAVLRALGEEGLEGREQKIMSFTDNRQDAALQSGHFNDFVRVCEIRSALNHALVENGVLDHSSVAQAVFDHLGLPQDRYARVQATFPGMAKRNEEAFKTYLFYRILQDLRRTWRISVPNLEFCGLLEIRYAGLEEACAEDDRWKGLPVFGAFDCEKRKEILYQILDFFRKSYAVDSAKYLTEKAVGDNEKEIAELLRHPWTFAEDEDIQVPCHLRLGSPPRGFKIFTESIGPRSTLGRYVKDTAQKQGERLSDEEYRELMEKVLSLCEGAGWTVSLETPDVRGEKVRLHRLRVSAIIWARGTGKAAKEDPVRVRSFRNVVEAAPNSYFRGLYGSDFRRHKRLEGAEHTGQLSNDDRIDREERFREGGISALFCSPTMELGIDIAELSVVHLRNVPPSPANYAQRSGRAGRSGQAALVFTNCSVFSPHDRHYFRDAAGMVAGAVAAPKIDICNEELVRTHLHAVYLAMKRVPGLTSSLKDLFDAGDETLPVRPEVREALQLSGEEKKSLRDFFERMIADYRPRIEESLWYRKDWIDRSIEEAPVRFLQSLERWRTMFLAVQREIDEASFTIRKGIYPNHDPRMKEAKRIEARGTWERGLLCNEISGGEYSEFYPFRYLAAEGFLPGYNFTRLPVRAYMPVGEHGEFISRPRFISLREFGPRNVIYHNGAKYRVDQMMVTDTEKSLTSVRIAPDSGYVMTEEEKEASVSLFNGAPLEGDNKARPIGNLLTMTEVKTSQTERISCEEEMRMSMGYRIETYFGNPGGMGRVRDASLVHEGKDFLHLKYLPACRLYQFNRGWKISREEGFLIGVKTGQWKGEGRKPEEGDGAQKEGRLRVSLYTHDTADALYLIPVKVLNLSPEGVVTLMYALKRAVEEVFQVEDNEIAAVPMGSAPNIILYEAAEGSLGVLSRITEDPMIFPRLVSTAWKILRYDDEEYKEEASYDDLLSYYNQRDHGILNRFLIKDALERLALCSVRPDPAPETRPDGSDKGGPERELRYRDLCGKVDASSPCEKKLLDYLHARGLRLPDEAQPLVPGVYCRPDFFYSPGTYIFCDGTAHDSYEIAERDEKQREDLLSAGYRYLVFHYDDDLSAFTSRHPDIFGKVSP